MFKKTLFLALIALLLLVATPSETEGELWPYQELSIGPDRTRRLGAFLLSFGQDADNELYVLTTTSAGPSGDTGAVYQIVPASGAGEGGAVDAEADTGTAVSPTDTMTATATVAPTTETTTPAVTATTTVTATEETTLTVGTDEPRALPVTGGPVTPWTSILLAAGVLAAMLGGAFLLRRRRTEDIRRAK